MTSDVALVAFDLDDTLAESKSAMTPDMAQVMIELLDLLPVCVISGGRFEQFESQFLANLPAEANLDELHLMPTCGTRYLRYDDGWRQIYAHDLDDDQKRRAIAAIEKRAKELGLWEPDDIVRGPRIEDRGSQITYSALGQQALVADKKAWDPTGDKRLRLRDAIAADIADLEVRAGGSTSIDITRQGIDKAYGIRRLADMTGISFDRMLFIGDRLQPGGNDYPVKALGVPTYEVAGPRDTLVYLRSLIDELKEQHD